MGELTSKKNDIVTVNQNEAAVDDIEENFLIIPLEEPIRFEGKTYEEIDLTGLKNIRAVDMMNVNRKMTKTGNVDVLPEMSLEYAINISAIATDLPIEFFEQLPMYPAMLVKGRVTAFLYGRA